MGYTTAQILVGFHAVELFQQRRLADLSSLAGSHSRARVARQAIVVLSRSCTFVVGLFEFELYSWVLRSCPRLCGTCGVNPDHKRIVKLSFSWASRCKAVS